MSRRWNDENLDEAVVAINRGELVAFPTETVYGLGADATNEMAVKAVYQAKGRPADNPLIVHVASQDDLIPFVPHISPQAKKIMDTFWPGPLTLVFDINMNSLPNVTTGGLKTCAFRMPDNQVTLSLIEKSGKVLVGPSANTSGKPSPTTADHVLHDLNGKISGVIDGGKTRVGLESTVLDLTVNPPMILRPGAITQEDLEKVLPKVVVDNHLVTNNSQPKAPGMKYKHYAPSIPVYMISFTEKNWQEALEWAKSKSWHVGILASKKIIQDLTLDSEIPYYLSEESTIDESMHELFSGLRFFDDYTPTLDAIFVETFAEKGLGIAYMNRLKKAANQRFFIKKDK